MTDRRPEQRHHRIADELLHPPAETLQLRPQPRIVRGSTARKSSGSICSAWEVKPTRSAKKHGHDLAFLMGRRRSLHQGSTALGAEFRPRLIPVAARAANAHRKSLRLAVDDVIGP
jgi:hypothetical protein